MCTILGPLNDFHMVYVEIRQFNFGLKNLLKFHFSLVFWVRKTGAKAIESIYVLTFVV